MTQSAPSQASFALPTTRLPSPEPPNVLSQSTPTPILNLPTNQRSAPTSSALLTLPALPADHAPNTTPITDHPPHIPPAMPLARAEYLVKAMTTEPDLAAINGLTLSLINTCYDRLRSVTTDLKPTIALLQSLNDVYNLYMTVYAEDPNVSLSSVPIDLISNDESPLVQCMNELHALERIMDVGNRRLGEPNLANVLDNLKKIQAALDIIPRAAPSDIPGREENSIQGNVDARYCTVINVGGDQNNYYTSFKDNVADELRQKIHLWLAAPDPSSNHNDACRKRQATTGEWFINGEEFRQWKSGLNSFIWLHGIPGSGKSVLCSTIIEEVSQSDPSSVLAYFYFDFSNTQLRRSESLIRSLTTQVSSQCSTCSDLLVTLYSQHLDGQRQPTTKSLMKTLKAMLRGFQQVYVIMDALDECEDQQQLLLLIQEITEWKLGTMHILATSRKEGDIEDCLIPCISAQINLHNSLVNADIQIYIQERLRNDTKLKKWSAKIHRQIQAALMDGADGMFRWVACQLDVLCKCIKSDELTNTLKSLPKTLEETYDRIFQNIHDEHIHDVHKVLQWLAFSARPVTLVEVAEALAVDFNFKNNCPQFNPDQRIPDPNDILVICSSLVTTSSPMWTSDDGIHHSIYTKEEEKAIPIEKTELKLAHFSVKEYLIGEQIRRGPVSQYSFNSALANSVIAQTCLAYLLGLDSGAPEIHSKFPLTDYAATYWITHVKSQLESNTMADAVQSLTLKLLQPKSDQFINWVNLFDKTPNFNPSPLYYTSLEGLELVSQQLLMDKEVDVNMQGGKQGNALSAAAFGGYYNIVQLLIEKGADVNAQGGQYGNALQAAASGGHQDTLMLLLEKGANVNAQGGGYGNALQAAASGDHQDTLKLLLEEGANVNAQGGLYGNALQAAASGGHQDTLKLLLEQDADVNAQGGWYGNALQAVACGGHQNTLKLLLEKGANVNAQGGWYGSALQAAAYRGHQDTLKLLLEKGANVNAQGGLYGNAFQAAASGSHQDAMKLLLEKGADIDAQKGEYDNALQAAAYRGHQNALKLLLENGGDVNTQVGKYSDFLQAVACGGHQDTLKQCANALQAAGHQDTLELLLERGFPIITL